ncbi:MAG: hypothetical protein RL662_1997 [Bacteroidota bacterium]|jgi:outer membrane protein
MKKISIAVCCFVFIVSLQAQNQKTWSLRDCIEFAVENNVEIKQQALQVKGAEIDLSTSKNSRLPDLNAQIGQSFNFGLTQGADNVLRTVNSSRLSWGANSTTPIFTGFKIPNDIKAKEFSLLAATEGLEKVKENLELQIVAYYLDILFKKEILKIYQEQAALTEKQVERTSILVESGKVAASQLYDIKAQLAKDQLSITTSNNDLQNSILLLVQALNLTSAQGFDIETPNTEDTALSANVLVGLKHPDQVYQEALGIKPHVKEAKYLIESSKKQLKVAQSSYYPKLELGLGYSGYYFNQYGSVNKVPFGDQFKNNRNEVVSLTLSIPIFNRFEVRNQVRKARLDIQNKEYNLTNVKLNLYKEIQQAYLNAVSAEAKYVSTGKAYDAATESFRYAEERYRLGKAGVFEYNEAQTKLINSRSEQVQAKYDFLFRNKILDFYQGKEISL